MNVEAYTHGFDGNCMPGNCGYFRNETFSVGIFQWLPNRNGIGMKRSAVKYRIKGSVDRVDAVCARAKEVCAFLDDGGVLNKKSERI